MLKRHWRNVFEWLDYVYARHENYMREESLTELSTLVWGYYDGLRAHAIVEDVPQMLRHFTNWLESQTGWHECWHWPQLIEKRYPDKKKSWEVFFGFVDKYRRLRSTRVCTVELAERHQRTGKRVSYGSGELLERPVRVDVIRYQPSPIHFLRFYYPDRVEDDDVLRMKAFKFATLRHAKEWVREELLVEYGAWMTVPKKEA